MIPVISPAPSSRSKSQQEVMADNAGHLYFSVHLKECSACRAEHERRLKKEAETNEIMMWITIPMVIAVIVIIHHNSDRAWLWLPWNKKRRLEMEAEDRKWRNYCR